MLSEQGEFVLSIKLSLANLNKQFQESKTHLRRETNKSKALADLNIKLSDQIAQYVKKVDML